jgi:HPt (histidine-containing phosphotransfer) domain-containing protein
MDARNSMADAGPVYSEFAEDPDYQELLKLFAKSIVSKRRDFEHLLQGGEMSQLQAAAHQLKGAAGGYGFRGLTALASELELACRNGDPIPVAAAVEGLLAYLDRITV